MRFGRGCDIRGDEWIFDPDGRFVYPPDPNPDDLCWCYSGKPYGVCHMARHLEPPLTDGEFIERWEKANTVEMCLHPNAPNGCSAIADAHTVQRRGYGLTSIAENGKVFGFKPHVYFLQKNSGRLVPELIGVGKASTFRGFCEQHDGELFKPVEGRDFIASQEQLFLLSFRTVARRVHAQHALMRQMATWGDYDRGRTRDEQRQMFVVYEHLRTTSEESLANITALKSAYDALAMQRDYHSTNALVVFLDHVPEFLCAGVAGTDYDFAGNFIGNPPPPAHLCFYNIAVGSGSAAVFSWIGQNSSAEALCASFVALPDPLKGEAVLRYALEHVDNIFFAPRWWNGLSPDTRDQIQESMTQRMHPFYSPQPTSLVSQDRLGATSECQGYLAVGDWNAK